MPDVPPIVFRQAPANRRGPGRPVISCVREKTAQRQQQAKNNQINQDFFFCLIHFQRSASLRFFRFPKFYFTAFSAIRRKH